MCGPDTYTGALNAQSQYAQGKMNGAYYDYLARQTDVQSSELDKATEQELSSISADTGRQMADVHKNANQTISSQKAAMAANGVYSDSGTASDIVGDTVDKMALDEAAVKYNADQSMWQTKRNAINQKLNLSAQSLTQRIQGNNARLAGKTAAISSIAGGVAGDIKSASKAGAGA